MALMQPTATVTGDATHRHYQVSVTASQLPVTSTDATSDATAVTR